MDPKNLEKGDFCAKNREKMAKSKKFGRKIFLVGIDSECFETYFKTMAKSKNFGRKIFLVGIDSEWFELYFKTKISKSKIFPV